MKYPSYLQAIIEAEKPVSISEDSDNYYLCFNDGRPGFNIPKKVFSGIEDIPEKKLTWDPVLKKLTIEYDFNPPVYPKFIRFQ